MKSTISIILSLFLVVFINAQEEVGKSTYYLSTSSSLNHFGEVRSLNFHASFGLRKNNHEWEIGPTFLLFPNYRSVNNGEFKLTGINTTYRIRPNSKGEVFDFYFKSTLYVQRIVDKWTAFIWDDDLGAYRHEDLRDIETLIQLYVGYGVQAKILKKRLFVFTSINFGGYYSDLEDPYEERLGVEYDFRGYGDLGTNWMINAGLGYNFLKGN